MSSGGALLKTFDENLAWQPAENMSMLLQYVLIFLSLVTEKKPDQGTKTETFMKKNTAREGTKQTQSWALYSKVK